MLSLRESHARGQSQRSWLDSRHTFSFGEYFDPNHTHVENLVVINEDIIAPSGGFPMHGHREMEIITYVISGQLEHQDNMGNGTIIAAGDVQHMSAGTGIAHSEFNPAPDTPVHLLQIWLQPDQANKKPSYDQKRFPEEAKRNRLCLLVSPDGAQQSLHTNQPSRIFASLLAEGQSVRHPLAPEHTAYVQIVTGRLNVAGTKLSAGDGIALREMAQLTLQAQSACEFLLFDLPKFS